MFNKDGFKEIGKNIYVYNNFLSNEECDLIVEDILKLNEDDWAIPPQSTAKGYFGTIKPIESILDIRKKIIPLLTEGNYFKFVGRGKKLLKGTARKPHTDIFQYQDVADKSDEYVEGQDFDRADLVTYGIILYFNEFEGGEIFYPNQGGLQYKPKKGDLLIHGAEEECRHGVKEVLSDVRYFSVGIFFNHVKVPKGYDFKYTIKNETAG